MPIPENNSAEMQKLLDIMSDYCKVLSTPIGHAWPLVLAYIRTLEKDNARLANAMNGVCEMHQKETATLRAEHRAMRENLHMDLDVLETAHSNYGISCTLAISRIRQVLSSLTIR